MHLDKFPGKREPKSGAFALFGVIISHLAEFLKDRFMILRVNADSCIAYRDFDTPRNGYGVDTDFAPFGREFDGIRQKVEQNLLELAFVRDKIPEPFVDVELDCQAMAAGPLPDQR